MDGESALERARAVSCSALNSGEGALLQVSSPVWEDVKRGMPTTQLPTTTSLSALLPGNMTERYKDLEAASPAGQTTRATDRIHDRSASRLVRPWD